MAAAQGPASRGPLVKGLINGMAMKKPARPKDRRLFLLGGNSPNRAMAPGDGPARSRFITRRPARGRSAGDGRSDVGCTRLIDALSHGIPCGGFESVHQVRPSQSIGQPFHHRSRPAIHHCNDLNRGYRKRTSFPGQIQMV